MVHSIRFANRQCQKSEKAIPKIFVYGRMGAMAMCMFLGNEQDAAHSKGIKCRFGKTDYTRPFDFELHGFGDQTYLAIAHRRIVVFIQT